MLMDKLTTLSNNFTLVGAAQTVVSDVLDLSQNRDLATNKVAVSVQFVTLPAGTAGATLNIALQTSPDNATWTTLEETAPQPITNYTAQNPWAFRGTLPAGGQRYYRMAYTTSAALTAGAVTAQIAGEWPRHPAYPRNFVA